MGVFLISYDLIDKKDYQAVYDKIKTYSKWAHILESVWLVESSQEAKKIRENISSITDNDDKIFVCRLSGDWATVNIGKEYTDWLKNRTFNCECS